MKILITGAGGNLGSGLISKLEDRHELRLSDLAPIETPHEFVQADVRERGKLVEAARGVDLIVHTPAWHGIHLSSRGESEFWELNVDGTFNAFRAAVENNVFRVVWISSQSVFSRDNIYGMTKVVGEDLCRFYHEIHDIRCTILRPADFTPYRNNKHYGERLLSGGVDRRDVHSVVALAAENAEVEFEAFPVLREDPFIEQDVEDWTQDSGDVLERYFPGARKLVERHDMDLPGKITIPDISSTKEKLGYEPRYNFITFLEELAEKDAAGKAGRWLKEA